MAEYDAYKYSPDVPLLHGTRWASEEEIKQSMTRVRLSDAEGRFVSGLPVISNGETVYVDDSDAHSLIIGSTGSKKTRLFAMPMLELIRRAGESAVVTDPKGELYDLTAASFEKSGYQVDVINLRDPYRSNGWNPLAVARAYQEAGNTERASGIVNDFAATFIPDATTGEPYWTQAARAMLQGLALMLIEGTNIFRRNEVHLGTLRKLSADLVNEPDHEGHPMMTLVKAFPAESTVRANLDAVISAPDKTFGSIKSSYEAPMQRLYLQKSLVSMLSHHDLDFNRLGLKKTVLYVIMPDEKTTLHAVVSLIIKQCYEMLIDLAQRRKGNALPVRVNFLLDEFSNLPRIPDMAAMISAARSRNIRFHLIIQGLYQLSSKYGQDDAQTIKGNCQNWAFLTSRELPLLSEISALCGEDSTTGEPLISTSQLQRLNKEKGEALMLLGRHYPYIAHLPDVSEYVMPRPEGTRPFPYLPRKRLAIPSSQTLFERALRATQPTSDFEDEE